MERVYLLKWCSKKYHIIDETIFALPDWAATIIAICARNLANSSCKSDILAVSSAFSSLTFEVDSTSLWSEGLSFDCLVGDACDVSSTEN